MWAELGPAQKCKLKKKKKIKNKKYIIKKMCVQIKI